MVLFDNALFFSEFNTSLTKDKLAEEKGNIGVMIMMSVATTGLLAASFPQFIDQLGFDPVLLSASKVILCTVIAFSLGYLIRSKLAGSSSNRQVFRELNSEVEQLENVILKAQERIKEIEARLPSNVLAMSGRGLDCLGLVRKIVRAVEVRHKDVRELLKSRSRLDLIDAYDLLNKKLIITESAYDSLIDSDPIPAIDPKQVIPTIVKLLEEIESEVRRVA